MAIITRRITNNLNYSYTILAPGANNNQNANLIIPASAVNLDLLTLCTEDTLWTLQPELLALQRQGSITVTGTIDTSAFDYDGVASLHVDNSPDIRGDIQLVSGANIALSQVGQVITISATGVPFPLLAPNGTVFTPSYSFAADPGTGIYSAGFQKLDFVTTGNGVPSMEMDTNTGITINTTTSMSGFPIINLADPSNPQDAATKNYVDTHTAIPGSPVNSIQFNNAGAFGGASTFIYDANQVVRILAPTSGSSTDFAELAFYDQTNTTANLQIYAQGSTGIGTINTANNLRVIANASIWLFDTSGNLTTPGNVYVPTGQVGIGTASPSFTLDVFGTSRFIGGTVTIGHSPNTNNSLLNMYGYTNSTIQFTDDFAGLTGTISAGAGGGLGISGTQTNLPVTINTTKSGPAAGSSLVIHPNSGILGHGTNTTQCFSANDFTGTNPQFVIGLAAANPSSTLDLQSTNGGLLLPRVTTAQRDAINGGTFTAGLQIYNTTTNVSQFWNGTAWVDMSGGGGGGSSTTSLLIASFGIGSLPNAREVATGITASNGATQTLYTCPAGRRAIWLQTAAYNQSGVTRNIHPLVVHNSITSSMAPIAGTPVGALTNNLFHATAIVLNAGDKAQISSTGVGLNVRAEIVEFDNTSPINGVITNSLVPGNNTVYTCPVGKTARIGYTATLTPNAGSIFNMNETGGAVTYHVNLVPNSGSVTTANQITPAQAFNSNVALQSQALQGSLAAGDFVSVNTSSAASGQLLWFIVQEISPSSVSSNSSVVNAGYAISLPTTADNGLVSNNTLTNTNSNFSVSVWVKFTASLSNNVICGTGQDDGVGGWVLDTPSGSPQFIVYAFDGSSEYTLTSSTLINDGKWHNIVVTYDIVAGGLLYIDGVLDPATPGGSVIANYTATSNPFFFIGNPPTQSIAFAGNITLVQLWGIILASTDVTTLFSGNNVTTGLLAKWAFTEGTGLTAADTVGGNTLTFTNINWPPSVVFNGTTWVAMEPQFTPTLQATFGGSPFTTSSTFSDTSIVQSFKMATPTHRVKVTVISDGYQADALGGMNATFAMDGVQALGTTPLLVNYGETGGLTPGVNQNSPVYMQWIFTPGDANPHTFSAQYASVDNSSRVVYPNVLATLIIEEII